MNARPAEAQGRQPSTPLRAALRVASVPSLLLLAGVLTYASMHLPWSRGASTTAVFLAVILWILLLEAIAPLRPAWRAGRSDWSLDSMYFASAAIFSGLGQLAALYAVLALHDRLHMEIAFWKRLPFLVSFVIANVIGEFLPYWYHRLSHLSGRGTGIRGFLWRVHAIHHLPPSLNAWKTNWMHPLNIFLNTFLKLFPLQLLGFDKDIVFAVGITNIVVAYLSHANLAATTGVLDYVIATPHVHHYHHSARPSEAKNYANILPIWDLVFGTYVNRRDPVATVGVESGIRTTVPAVGHFWRHMRFPFVPRP